MQEGKFFSIPHMYAMSDVIFFGFLYFTFGVITSLGINWISTKIFKQDNSQKSTFKIIIEIYIEIAALLIAYHIYAHHIIRDIKPPFYSLYQYKIGEKSNTVISAFAIFLCMKSLINKINYLIEDRFKIYYTF